MSFIPRKRGMGGGGGGQEKAKHVVYQVSIFFRRRRTYVICVCLCLVLIIRVALCHYDPKYNYRLDVNIQYKRLFYFDSEWYYARYVPRT